MSKLKHDSAILKDWGLPIFPDSLVSLSKAQDENDISTWDLLEKSGLLVDGYVQSDRSITLDGYFWFCDLYFIQEDGEVAILFPWEQDFKAQEGDKKDRSIAVYTKGKVDIEKIILQLIEAMGTINKEITEKYKIYYQESRQRHHDLFVFLYREKNGILSEGDRKNYESAMERESAGEVEPLPEDAINYFKVKQEKPKESKG